VYRSHPDRLGAIKTEAELGSIWLQCFVLKCFRHCIPPDQPWGGPSHEELAALLAELNHDRGKRKYLKEMAEAIVWQPDRRIQYPCRSMSVVTPIATFLFGAAKGREGP